MPNYKLKVALFFGFSRLEALEMSMAFKLAFIPFQGLKVQKWKK